MPNFGPPPPLLQDDFLDLLRRNFEDHWIEGLLEDPSSLSVFVGMAAVFTRVAAAADESVDVDGYVLTAPGGHPAESIAVLSRPPGLAGTLSTTLRFRDQRGLIWRPVASVDVPLASSPQTINVPIQTDRDGYFANSFLPPTFQLLDVPFDPNFIVVAGTTPATQGTAPALDLHGGERSAPRAPGEADDTYRLRMLQVPDQVSPRAIAGVVPTVLAAYGNTAFIADLITMHGLAAVVEPFEDSAQISQVGLRGQTGFFCDARCFADDPHGPHLAPPAPIFDVYLPMPANVQDQALFADFGFADDYQQGFTDVEPSTVQATALVMAALADMLDKRRADGVAVRIILGEDVHLIKHPAATMTLGTWTVAGAPNPLPPTDPLAALAAMDGDFDYVTSSSGASAGGSVDPSDALFTVPGIPAPQSPPAPSSPIRYVVIRGWARTVPGGVNPSPTLAFVFGAVRTLGLDSAPYSIDHEDWREYVQVLEQNPATSLPWQVSDLTGTITFGLANATVGATTELRASELALEVVANYG